MRRDRQPRAQHANEYSDPYKVERPGDEHLEDPARSILYSERDRDHFCAQEIQEADEQNPAGYDRGERPEWSTRRVAARTYDLPFYWLENRIDLRPRESRDPAEDVDPARPHHPVDETKHAKYPSRDEHDKTNRAEDLIKDSETRTHLLKGRANVQVLHEEGKLIRCLFDLL